MRVAELIEQLKAMNQDAEAHVGMWYGPGAPDVQTYAIERVGERDPKTSDGRYDGPHVVWIAGSDPNRAGRLGSPDQSIRRAQDELRRASDRVHGIARDLGEWVSWKP